MDKGENFGSLPIVRKGKNMYTIYKKVLRALLKKKFQTLVGRSCKRIEVIRDTENLDNKTKLTLIKDLIKELDYETMRDLEDAIRAFSEGTQLNVNLTKPTK